MRASLLRPPIFFVEPHHPTRGRFTSREEMHRQRLEQRRIRHSQHQVVTLDIDNISSSRQASSRPPHHNGHRQFFSSFWTSLASPQHTGHHRLSITHAGYQHLSITLVLVGVSSSLRTPSAPPLRSGRRQRLLDPTDTVVSITHAARHRLLITLVLVGVCPSLSTGMRGAPSTRRTSTTSSYRPNRSSKLCASQSCIHCPVCLLFADIFMLVSDGHCLQASGSGG